MHLPTISRVVVAVLGTGFASAAPAARDLPVAPALSAAATSPNLSVEQVLAAHAPERVLVPSLRGVLFIGDPAAAAEPVPAGFQGLDTSRVALFQQHRGVAQHVNAFLGRPASLPSLSRLAMVVRLSFQERGENFVVAYVPPQDLTEGVVRVVVARARLEGEVAVEGAAYFSPAQYRRALRFAPGTELDAAALQSATDALNRNPFRRVTATVEAGAEPASSRIALHVQERRPWQFTAGYNNTGTTTTDEDRVSAGVTWGNAFGRGDVLGYSFGSDPGAKHMVSHSANYTTTFASGRTLTGYGSWSRIESVMPAPLTQEGSSWQTGLRFAVPLRAPGESWTHSLSFNADFKSSDNTLEFATIPVTDNVTHVAQLGVTYDVSWRRFGGQNAISLSGCASPGGLTRDNDTSAFAGSRPGAKADYVYGRLGISHQRLLAWGFAWLTKVEAQLASGALLGSEQLNGGGSYAVRGYRESSAFGDGGVVVNNELHAPGFALFKGSDHLDLFAFADLASLNLNVDDESTDLRSAGLGLSYQWRRYLTVRASYGWQLKQLDFSADSGRAHLSANLSW